jgi:hypothetical protein
MCKTLQSAVLSDVLSCRLVEGRAAQHPRFAKPCKYLPHLAHVFFTRGQHVNNYTLQLAALDVQHATICRALHTAPGSVLR